MTANTGTTDSTNVIPEEALFSSVCNIVYILWWTKKQWLRRVVFRSAKVFFVLGLLTWIAEIVLEGLHLGGFLFETNRIVGIVVFGLLLLFLYDRIRDLRERANETVFLVTANLTVDALDQLRLDSGDREAKLTELRNCIDEMLKTLLEAFAERGGLNVNVMLPTSSDSPEQLKMWLKTSEQKYDSSFQPLRGEGGAGTCFDLAKIIYFPNIRRRHGVAISFEGTDARVRLTVYPNLYKQVSPEHYKSILCVPITARGKCFGVLNIDTSKKDPFGGYDYRSLAFFASMLGLALDRYQVASDGRFF